MPFIKTLEGSCKRQIAAGGLSRSLGNAQSAPRLHSEKPVSWGYSYELKRLSDLLREADAHLFRKMVNNKKHYYCIRHFFTTTGRNCP